MKHHTKARTLLVVGGTRSGKSDMALRWAEAMDARRIFLATAQVADEAMARRVEMHQLERGAGWETMETPVELLASLQKAEARGGVLVVDCVGEWLNNLIMLEQDEKTILRQVEAVGEWLRHTDVPVVLVSTEAGMGLMPVTPEGRLFRDVQGEANQILADACRTALFICCGQPLALKGAVPEPLQ